MSGQRKNPREKLDIILIILGSEMFMIEKILSDINKSIICTLTKKPSTEKCENVSTIN